MSRHTFTEGHIEATVGWDPPLNTFFAQVWDRSKDPDEPDAELLWVGCSPGEIHDPVWLLNRVSAFLPVPLHLHQDLYREAHA